MYQERPERGKKHLCSNCGTRFYDFMHVPAICPKCGKEAVAAVRPPSVPRRNPARKSFAKSHPVQSPPAEKPENPAADDSPADDADRRSDDGETED